MKTSVSCLDGSQLRIALHIQTRGGSRRGSLGGGGGTDTGGGGDTVILGLFVKPILLEV